jgi:acetylornithine deacetylase/succinyl-diaminopimelate desuccinylase-like protein
MRTRYRVWTAVVATVLVASASGAPGQEAAVSVARLLTEPRIKAALEAARTTEAQTIDEQIRFCEVPAPPFQESARAQLLQAAFQRLGLHNVRIDRAGNVLGDRPGTNPHPRLVVAAHLDTVFPEGTNVTVRRQGNTLRGPGIGDNCRGLAVLVAVVRVLRDAGVQTPGSITFVANVGEEGLGDLRGMKTLFFDTMKGQIDRFVSIDGPGMHVTHVAVGSHRYRMTFKGPGGHSFGAFGLPNPANALGRAVAKIAELQVPSLPRTTFNVGRIGGGTSVNAVPAEAWMEVDMRSSDPAALAALDTRIQEAVDAGVVEENRRWKAFGRITVTKELVGDRPAGSIPTTSPIVQTVLAAGRAVLGTSVPFSEGSTDANLPVSLNIPAVAIGGGGDGDDAHVTAESFNTEDSWKGTANAVLVTISLAQK